MQALSMHQPWASLTAKRVKQIETRDRRPPANLIGERIAIHATRRIITFDPDAMLLPADRDLFTAFNQAVTEALGPSWQTELPTGAVVATVVLKSIRQVRTHVDLPESPTERLFGEYATGRWLWELDDVHELAQPVPARGYPSFWTWTPPTDHR